MLHIDKMPKLFVASLGRLRSAEKSKLKFEKRRIEALREPQNWPIFGANHRVAGGDRLAYVQNLRLFAIRVVCPVALKVDKSGRFDTQRKKLAFACLLPCRRFVEMIEWLLEELRLQLGGGVLVFIVSNKTLADGRRERKTRE